MSYKGFYRYIDKTGDTYSIRKNNERFGTYNTLADALYERDRLIAVDWDWDALMELPETNNNYIHIDLPPFHHDEPTYISVEKEYWMVRGKGRRQKYFGKYGSLEEAKKVAMIYNANISHKSKRYVVKKTINGKKKYFGSFLDYEDAEKLVEELKANNWEK